MVKTIKVRKLDDDFWGRKRFQNVDTKSVYADVDGVLHTTTKDGEPCCPLRKDLKIKVVK